MSKRTEKPARNWMEMLAARAPWICLALVSIATVRIVSTYWVFNHVVDEPFHIAMGLEWLTKGTYATENQHPPLARVLGAIGPYLDGAKLLGGGRSLYDEGAYVLYGGQDYDKRLALARAGVLPLFWIACWVLYAWCVRWLDRATAVVAVALFTTLPAILAHSGLAATDMALVAGMAVAIYGLVRLLEEPTWKQAALFGAGLGFAVLTKFSALAFLPCIAALALAMYARTTWPLKPASWPYAKLGASLALAAAVIWAGFRFHFGKPIGWNFAVPAPEFFDGIEMVRKHNADGHMSWLLGEFSMHGFWYFYPVALLFKTPLGFLALALWGVWIAAKSREWRIWLPLACAAGILGFALTSHINIGIRHVLPVYFFLSVLAAVAVARSSGGMRTAALVCVAWAILSPAVSHPDYLGYFNFLAGTEPETVLVDSDLDWGQDMKRLGEKLQSVGAQQVAMDPLNFGFWEEAHGFPRIVPLDPKAPRPGWNAVSLTMLELSRMGTRGKLPVQSIWTDTAKPTARVGSGILLYFNPVR